MANDSPAEVLAAELVKLSKSQMVIMSGHAGTLKVLADYLGEQQRRLVDAETRLAVLERQVKSIQLRPPDRTESVRITNRAGSIDIPLTADGAIDYQRVLGGDGDG